MHSGNYTLLRQVARSRVIRNSQLSRKRAADSRANAVSSRGTLARVIFTGCADTRRHALAPSLPPSLPLSLSLSLSVSLRRMDDSGGTCAG
jgi:hypothetical protein